MKVETYLAKRAALQVANLAPRALCTKCRHAKVVCDCDLIKPFQTTADFILLIHPEEARRRIATGRLTHQLIETSQLIEGESFEANQVVSRLLEDPTRQCVVLYPGASAIDLSLHGNAPLFDSSRKMTVFVLDGTWRTAKKMLRLSPSLARLPQICFQPPRPSSFRIRKQPDPICFSTLEAVHHLIGLLEPNNTARERLIEFFDRMVERQILYARNAKMARRGSALATDLSRFKGDERVIRVASAEGSL